MFFRKSEQQTNLDIGAIIMGFWTGNEWKTEIIANRNRFYVEKFVRSRAKEMDIYRNRSMDGWQLCDVDNNNNNKLWR